MYKGKTDLFKTKSSIKKVKVLLTTEYITACPNRYTFIIYVDKKVPSLCSRYYTSRKKAINALNKTLAYYNMEAESILG